MKVYENGIIRDMTPEEIAEAEESSAKAAAAEKHRPLAMTEVQEMLLTALINTLTVDDATAYRMIAFYPSWAAGTDYKPVGYKVVCNGRLWKLRKEHTAQDGWEPGATGTESLWEEICEQHDGTKYDPIPYSGNMALENGKYYSQAGVTYLCNRDTGSPVYNALADLVAIYVEVVAT